MDGIDQARRMFLIGRREFWDSLLTVRTIVVGAIFLLAVGVLSYGVFSFGGIVDVQSHQLAGTAIALVILVITIPFFGPIFGIVSGFDTVTSERTEGTLALVLSKPIHKITLLSGKFLGRAAAISVPVLVGLGLGFATTSFQFDFDLGLGLFFIGVTILLVLAFQAIAQAFSTAVSSNTTAVLGGIGLWLMFVPLWGMFDFLLVDEWGLDQGVVNVLNPTILYRETLRNAVTAVADLPSRGAVPGSANVAVDPLAGLILHLVVFVGLSLAVFHLQDEA